MKSEASEREERGLVAGQWPRAIQVLEDMHTAGLEVVLRGLFQRRSFKNTFKHLLKRRKIDIKYDFLFFSFPFFSFLFFSFKGFLVRTT